MVELIKVNEQYIQCLDINVPIIVDEIEVTALDANQYVIIFFLSPFSIVCELVSISFHFVLVVQVL